MDMPCKTVFRRRRPNSLSTGPEWVQNVSAIFLGAIFAAATASVANAAIPAGERTVLLNFYNATNGDMWGNKTGWLGSPGTECSWHGVTCDAGENHVTNLNMVGNHLHGRLPDLSPLTELQALGLNDNLLSGNIPSLVNLHHLQTLWLARNLLSGPVPPLNASLTDIDVSSNALSGSIPPLSAAPMLAYAYFDENLLTGTIPDLSSLSNLIVFSVDGNLLTGPIPSLAGLNALGDLAVARNNLSGSIPSIAGLPALVTFDVSNNQLTGVLPANFPSGLQAFYANSNSLSGTMPSLASTQLHVFRIEGNAQLNGQVAAAPTPNSLVSGVSGLCPSGLVASGNNQLNSVWSVATGHTPWDYNNACAQQNANVFQPSVNLSFSPSNIVIGGAGSQMTISMSNPNAQAITGIAFTDSYPAGMANASLNPILQNSCGGVLTAAAGSCIGDLVGRFDSATQQLRHRYRNRRRASRSLVQLNRTGYERECTNESDSTRCPVGSRSRRQSTGRPRRSNHCRRVWINKCNRRRSARSVQCSRQRHRSGSGRLCRTGDHSDESRMRHVDVE